MNLVNGFESFSHLVDLWNSSPGSSTGTGYLHHRQYNMTKMKGLVVFRVMENSPEDEEPTLEFCPIRLITVPLPFGISMPRVRLFVNFCEDQLRDIYKDVDRVNFYFVREESTNLWTCAKTLPTVGVAYV